MGATSEFFDPFAIPLVGRDSVMSSAAQALDSAPGCIVIVGEPKVGVTRLATEIMRLAEQTYASRCDAMEATRSDRVAVDRPNGDLPGG